MSMARWLLYIQIASISHTEFMRGAHTSFLVLTLLFRYTSTPEMSSDVEAPECLKNWWHHSLIHQLADD